MTTEQTSSADEDLDTQLKAAEKVQRKNVTNKPCETLTSDIDDKIFTLYLITLNLWLIIIYGFFVNSDACSR